MPSDKQRVAAMLRDFVLETVNAPGTATTLLLAGAPADRVTFAQAFASGSNAFYYLDDGTQAEWGWGVFTAGTPNTLTRAVVEGNTAGTTSKLNFAGTTNVYNDVPSKHVVYTDSSGNVTVAGTVSALKSAVGGASLNPGSATAPGYVAFFNASGTRVGYAGF